MVSNKNPTLLYCNLDDLLSSAILKKRKSNSYLFCSIPVLFFNKSKQSETTEGKGRGHIPHQLALAFKEHREWNEIEERRIVFSIDN